MNHQNHTYLKRRSGIYYFTRRIPNDLQRQYKRDRLYVSLRTRSKRKAMAASEKLSNELEALWSQAHIKSIAHRISRVEGLSWPITLSSRRYCIRHCRPARAMMFGHETLVDRQAFFLSFSRMPFLPIKL